MIVIGTVKKSTYCWTLSELVVRLLQVDYIILLAFRVFFAVIKMILQVHTLKRDITFILTTHLVNCLDAFPDILACEHLQMCSILAMHN